MNSSPGVVLLHGLARTSRSLRIMERALQGAGFATLNLDYQSRRRRIETLADDIHAPIAKFAGEVGPLHFVAHSMGGLLARIYLASYRPARLGRVVMLGTPNGGSEVADLLRNLALYRAYYGPAGQQVGTRQDEFLIRLPPPDYAVGIVAGNRTIDPVASFFIVPRPNDGRVSIASTKLEGMKDHVVMNTSHSLMLLNRDVIRQTIAFLREGRFETKPRSLPSLRGAPATKQSSKKELDCFVEPVIGRAFRPTRWLAMTQSNDATIHGRCRRGGAALLQMICRTVQG